MWVRKNADLQVIGEVSDGLVAVQKAAELQPDLVVLDIGLPSLKGIEVARQIRKLRFDKLGNEFWSLRKVIHIADIVTDDSCEKWLESEWEVSIPFLRLFATNRPY